MAPPTLATAQWSPDGADWVLRGTGTNGERVDLARLSDGSHLPPVHSPRPFLHPVRTARGLDLTDVTPVDHRHHYGTSLALPMVNGTSYWGGRTFLRDEGPTLLPNHGRQIVRSVAPGTEQGCLTHSVEWLTERGEHLLSEQRRLSAAPLHDGWRITWESELLADGGDLRIESPATNGRPGAGYGRPLLAAGAGGYDDRTGRGCRRGGDAPRKFLPVARIRPAPRSAYDQPHPRPAPGAGPAVVPTACRVPGSRTSPRMGERSNCACRIDAQRRPECDRPGPRGHAGRGGLPGEQCLVTRFLIASVREIGASSTGRRAP